MFFPKAMTEIELIVPARDLVPVTKVLSGQGVFHQAESGYSYPGAETGVQPGESWQSKASAFAALERRIQIILQTLALDEGQPPTQVRGQEIELEKITADVDQIEQEVKNTGDQLISQEKLLEQLRGSLSQLEPINDVGVDFSSLRDSRFLYSVLGVMPAGNVQRLETSLARVPHVFMTLRADSQKHVVLLAGPQANADVLERAVRSSYLNPLTLPDGYSGTPADIIKSLKSGMETAEKKIAELKTALGRLADTRRDQLLALYWEVHAGRRMADAIVRFGRLRYTYVVVGWVLTDKLEELIHHLKQASKEILIETIQTGRSGHNRNIPVALRHSSFLRPFQMLVTTYARPRYGELDPTWLIAVMFPLLFGAMFGDLGQGLVLAVLGGLMSSGKIKALRGMASLGGLIAVCGLSAAVFGLLYGSVFGFEEILHPLWINPLHDSMTVLTIAIGTGVVLINLAFLIGIMNNWISRDWGHLFFGHNGIAGFLLYVSLLGLLAASFLPGFPIPQIVFVVLAVAAGLAVMFSEVFINLVEGHRPVIEGGIGTYAIQAPVELFEVVISLFSNSLSFVRVGAFAIAHGILSSVFFILAELVGPVGGAGYWIVIVIGNIFILGFEGLIVGIQTMRLSYYEVFSKFFTGGGMRFEPLTLAPAREE